MKIPKWCIPQFILSLLVAISMTFGVCAGYADSNRPEPLLRHGTAVDWWFVFKFNTKSFPGCGNGVERKCPFGGEARNYQYGQQFLFASSVDHHLQKGSDCVGDTTEDPVGATFDEIYSGKYHYVVWNDQFYDDPKIAGCNKSCGAPWGHSKGMLAWVDSGEGLALQVTTPSWPASGSKDFPRKSDGNTLGCVEDDNVKVSQHFFAIKLSKDDVIKVLKALQNASVVTDPNDPQIVNNGGPPEIQELVKTLGVKSKGTGYIEEKLSDGIELISKPSRLNVPPWQMVSAILGGVPLRTATWWATPKIYSTTTGTGISCWDSRLGHPGSIEIALTGQWDGITFGLTGGPGTDFNHAKIGVSVSGSHHYAIFGDMNQQGTLSGEKCSSSQNGRGGLFYVLDDEELSAGLAGLMAGTTAPTHAPGP